MVDNAATDAQSTQALSGDMVLVVTHDGMIHSVLEAPEQSCASGTASFIDRPLEDILPNAVVADALSGIKRSLRARQVQNAECEDQHNNRHYEFIFVPQGRDRVLLVVRDISAAKDAMNRIRQLAYTDPVTSLPNREFLYSELTRVTDMQRLKQGRAAVICIHVEPVADNADALIAGQEDAILEEIAARLSTQLRGINDATQRDFERFSVVARTDFRQFTIVLPSIETGEDAESVILRLLGALQQPVALGDRSITPAVNSGVALFPQDGTDAESLYTNARVAMDDARNNPLEPYRFHSGTVRLRNLQRQDLAADLQSALERGDFRLNYLPIVDAGSGGVRSLEALLRWPQSVLGSRTTRKIVAIAEYTGLIVELGEWVLRRACEQMQSWRAAGHDELRLAVNLSAQEFSRADLADRVGSIVAETGADATLLDVEISEEMLFRDAVQRHSRCAELTALGMGIALDDFGTGCSTLALLSQSPVGTIKIDTSFVANVEVSERDRAACKAAISMGHGLGMQVVAEGVETKAQAEFLREHGCDLLQGFLISQPLAGDELLPFLGAAADGGLEYAS